MGLFLLTFYYFFLLLVTFINYFLLLKGGRVSCFNLFFDLFEKNSFTIEGARGCWRLTFFFSSYTYDLVLTLVRTHASGSLTTKT